MTRTRQFIATICCFIVAPILLYRSFIGLPVITDLDKIEGVVSDVQMMERNSKYAQTEHPAISLEGRGEVFLYLDWFPKPEVLIGEIKPGDYVKLLTDINENQWIWEIEKNGKIIVDYNEIKNTVRKNNQYDPLISFILLIAGGFGVFRLSKSKE